MAVDAPSATELLAFQNLRSMSDLARFFNTTLRRLRFHLYARSRPTYCAFHIRKASGDTRLIEAPRRSWRGFRSSSSGT